MARVYSAAVYASRLAAEYARKTWRLLVREGYLYAAAAATLAAVFAAQLRGYRETGLALALEAGTLLVASLPVLVDRRRLTLLPALIYYGFLVAAVLAGLPTRYPVFYLAYTPLVVVAALLAEPRIVLPAPVRAVVYSVRAVWRKRSPPETRVELYAAAPTIGLLAGLAAVSAVIAAGGYRPALLPLAYNSAASAALLLGIGARRIGARRPPKVGGYPLLFVVKYRFAYRIAQRLAPRIDMLSKRSGTVLFPLAYVAPWVLTAVTLALAAPGAGLLAYALKGPVAGAAVAAAALGGAAAAYHAPLLTLSLRVSQRRVMLEREYPFFLAYLAVLTSAGYSLADAMRELAYGTASKLFPGFSREARLFLYLLKSTEGKEERAFAELAAHHPSETLREFYYGLTSRMELTGRVAEYIMDKLRDALEDLKSWYQININRMSVITEIVLIILTFPPTLGIAMSALNPAQSEAMIRGLVFFGAPLTVAFFYLASSGMVLNLNKYPMKYVLGGVGGVAALLAARQLGLPVLEAASVTAAGIAAGVYVEYLRWEREYSALQRYLPTLWRDMGTYSESLPLHHALIAMSRASYYPEPVRRVLRRFAAFAETRPSEAPWASGSWLWRLTQFLWAKMSESGGATRRVFREMVSFLSSYNHIKSTASMEVRLLEFTSYIIPVLLVIVKDMSAFIQSQLSVSVSAAAGGALSSALGSLAGAAAVSFAPLIGVLIFEISLGLGIVMGIAVSGTWRNTRPLLTFMLLVPLAEILAPLILPLR